ncbi:ATP-grasp domain-containing protein [Couchioplanes caeruleus]|uniref:ATP-grasp domain-containing protein n=1 Tax=Couchioplanes caeruleus TaxID=56438 RepID=UPI0020C0BF05|nr:ATP-grasp domain-containing protein [Couchioplanes caeruleus]UQU61450.1 ATP-grasp domain-containing protein [Couchioplanes caeruleus]
MTPLLLVPSDPLRPRRPDEHFAAEAAAAREAGIAVALIDHDAAARDGGADTAVSTVRVSGPATYRGWMLRAEHYAALERSLAGRGVVLATTAGQYRQAHELPGWYDSLAQVTPETVWTAGDDRDGFDKARAELGEGPAVLRDYTKSMKHYWHEAAYIPDVADGDAAWRVASRFRELRGDDFTGGFVLRRFESFTAAEVRTWWVGGECRLVTAHPDSPAGLPPADVDLSGIGALGLPFVTVDLALRDDGRWRVIELGDGQVSDRPASTPPEAFLAALMPDAGRPGLVPHAG